MRDDPAVFSFLDELLVRLKAALPNVDEPVLATGESGSQILMAREFEFNDDQLRILGLAR